MVVLFRRKPLKKFRKGISHRIPFSLFYGLFPVIFPLCVAEMSQSGAAVNGSATIWSAVW